MNGAEHYLAGERLLARAEAMGTASVAHSAAMALVGLAQAHFAAAQVAITVEAANRTVALDWHDAVRPHDEEGFPVA
jgi:hypothetical protein